MTTTVATGSSSRSEIIRLAVAGQPLPSPVEAYFEVANRCNSKCATCPLTFSPQEQAKQLSLEEFKALVDQLPDLRRAVMQGIGEPLLNRDLAPMIRHLKDRDSDGDLFVSESERGQAYAGVGQRRRHDTHGPTCVAVLPGPVVLHPPPPCRNTP